MENRTSVRLAPKGFTPEEAVKNKKPGRAAYSEFLLTVNPNRVFLDPTSPDAQDMIEKLSKLGNTLLDTRAMRRYIKFIENAPGGVVITPAEQWTHYIDEIDPTREAVVEYGYTHNKNLHLHATFWIKHRTKIQIDRKAIEILAANIVNLERGKFHINFKATYREGFKNYIRKNDETKPVTQGGKES